MAKKRGNLSVVTNDDLEDEFEDEFEDEEEEDDEDDEEEVLEDEEEEEEENPPKPVRRGSKRTPPPVAEADSEEEADDDEDFEQALGEPNTPSKSPSLRGLSDDQLVIELTDLVLQGDDSEMTSILHLVFVGPRGPKIAKQLVREARDRAVARIRRVANVAQVNIDTFTDDD